MRVRARKSQQKHSCQTELTQCQQPPKTLDSSPLHFYQLVLDNLQRKGELPKSNWRGRL